VSAVEGDPDEVLTDVIGEWLQFCGPLTPDLVASRLGVDRQRLSLALEDLTDSRQAVVGQLVAEGEEDEVCDAENFEILLRMARARAIPAFEPLEAEALPLFVAAHQGLTAPADKIDGLFQGIEQLLCLPLPAAAWESDVFPARLQQYTTSWLDTVMQEGDLRWLGNGDRRVAFCFESDLALMAPQTSDGEPAEAESDLDDLIPESRGRYDFSTLQQMTRLSSNHLSDRLWEAVWQGSATNDTFAALRKGIQNRFKVPKVTTEATRHTRGRPAGVRAGFARWKGSLPSAGNWFRLPPREAPEDALEAGERSKDRARLLLDRYGIVFREILEREAPEFRWGGVFRALRLMELSGEVLAGYFFHGIPGPQFTSHQAFRTMQRHMPEDAVYWLSATDPASLCGLGLESTRTNLPRRIAGTHLVYRGRELVAVSRRNGKDLILNVPADDERLPEYLGFLRHMLTRQFQPVRRVTIETINGEDAARSPYVDAIRTAFDVTIDYKSVIVYRRSG
jgi:ATP-dependent Lhr-like helicase